MGSLHAADLEQIHVQIDHKVYTHFGVEIDNVGFARSQHSYTINRVVVTSMVSLHASGLEQILPFRYPSNEPVYNTGL